MAIPATYTFVVSDNAAICASQTTGAAGALVINGTYVDQNALGKSVRRALLPGGFGRPVTLNSTGALNGINFTITGLDVYKRTVSETIAGPNNNTVSTTQEFETVTSITADAAVGTAILVGIGTTGSTRPYTASTQLTPSNFALYGTISGTLTWSVQDSPTTINEILLGGATPASIIWFNHPTLSSATSNLSSNYAFPVRFIRGVVNSSASNASAQITITQAGV